MSSNTTLQTVAVAVAVMLTVASSTFAQTAGSQAPGGRAMPGMDMTAMMKQCTQMRQQMQPGMRMTPEMQSMMRQCDAMNQQMSAPADTTGASRPRTR